MAQTMQTIVDLARVPLNDAKKARYTDAVLLGYVNAAIHRAYELRPDLMIGTSYAGYTALPITATFPLADRFAQTVADYAGGRAELKDDDGTSFARAQLLLNLFAAELVS
jgi:hypothetical protein